MIESDEARRLEMERETNRFRGKEFKKWQRESTKIERNRVRNAEIETKRELEKENKRDKAQIRCKAERLKCQHRQQQKI